MCVIVVAGWIVHLLNPLQYWEHCLQRPQTNRLMMQTPDLEQVPPSSSEKGFEKDTCRCANFIERVPSFVVRYRQFVVLIGAVLRRLLAKCVLSVAKGEAQEACGIDQLCGGLQAGIEGGHTMHSFWETHKMEEE